jgi:ABC-2 type transport system permease protein
MLRQIFAIAYKELRLWLQVPGNWLVVFLVPLAFIGILGSVFGKTGLPVVTVFAVNADKGERGAEIIDLLAKSENLEFEMLSTQAEADARVAKGDRMAAVVIPENFSEAVTTSDGGSILVIVDPARAKEGGLVTGLVQSALIKSIVYAEIDRAMQGLFKGKSVEGVDNDSFKVFINAGIKAVLAKAVNDAIDNPLIKVQSEPLTKKDTSAEISIMSSLAPGFALFFAFFLISHLASTVIDERETGTLRRLITSPVSRVAILFGKALPFVFVTMVQITFILMLCNLMFGMELGNQPLALALIILCIGLAVAGLGILVAAVVRSGTAANVGAMLVAMVLGAVSGCMMPQVKVEGLMLITPHYWALEGIQNVIARGMGLEGVLTQAGILLGMAVLFFVIGAWRFKFE